ncbi:MAG: DUF1080 domain-containing protein [Armatimonadetes bacterium]|nr:DUF1080 domain-containing protein [Armatimonadota bacterium]
MNKITRAIGLALFALLVMSAAAMAADPTPPPPAGDGKWVNLFNGKDLDGWIPKIRGYVAGEDPLKTFRVEDGVIKVGYENYGGKFGDRFGHLFYKTPYGRYRLRLEYRFTGDQCSGGPGWAYRNSGIMCHGQSPESMTKDQDFPVSIEVQLLGGNGKDERSTMNLCTPGTNVVIDGKLFTPHCVNSRSKTFHGDQWVKAEVEFLGSGKVRHWVNGELVFEYEQPQLDPNDGNAKPLIKDGKLLLEKGTFSLQSESHPCEFRNIEIMEIP